MEPDLPCPGLLAALLPTPVLPGTPQSPAALAEPWFPSPGRAVRGPAHVREPGQSSPRGDGDVREGSDSVCCGGYVPPALLLPLLTLHGSPRQGLARLEAAGPSDASVSLLAQCG